MKVQPLIDLRNRLKTDADLQAYLLEKYGKLGRYVIGQQRPQNVETDYPYFSVFTSGENRDASAIRLESVVIIYWYIYQPNTVDDDPDTYKGVIEHCEIGELILTALYAKPYQNFRLKYETTTLTDFQIQHPYYGGGSQLTVQHKL